ncbi:MAG: chorismate synthase [Deltaproteobacteria bacterium]|nr:MAG: chorismate synthase [Deltaproteobacteria bacterium]
MLNGNTFGQFFRVTTWGESHGLALGAVIDGCPAQLPLTEDDIQHELEMRRPGKKGITTSRKEPDRVQILSGTFEGKTTGTPISLIVWNKDVDSSAYEKIKVLFRPGHADYTYQKKYGIRDWRGGGRASGRETVARVASGAVAQKLLDKYGIKVLAYTVCLGGIEISKKDLNIIEENPLFCPDEEASKKMLRRLAEVKKAGDSLGGVVEVVASGCQPGLGEPVFGKLDAALAGALMSIGAVKGVEIGSGFQAAELLGSQNNDQITPEGFESNNSGGILGGISTGQDVVVRVAIKPIPSIEIEQKTIDTDGNPATISTKGRHDVSAIPRIVPVCAAMVKLTLADFLLAQVAREHLNTKL